MLTQGKSKLNSNLISENVVLHDQKEHLKKDVYKKSKGLYFCVLNMLIISVYNIYKYSHYISVVLLIFGAYINFSMLEHIKFIYKSKLSV